MSLPRSNSAAELVRRWNLNVKHALYRKTGDWYHQLERFPGAFLDKDGYVIFADESEYRSCPHLRIRQHVTVRKGIKTIPEYTFAPQASRTDEPESSQEKIVLLEGTRTEIAQSRLERNSKVRTECLKEHGVTCAVCGLDFAKYYGAIGIGFIHVHHLRPLAEGTRQVDPTADLRPLCPNCHAMVHRKTPPLTIEELKNMIATTSGRLSPELSDG